MKAISWRQLSLIPGLMNGKNLLSIIASWSLMIHIAPATEATNKTMAKPSKKKHSMPLQVLPPFFGTLAYAGKSGFAIPIQMARNGNTASRYD
jgi:hypothetical protein